LELLTDAFSKASIPYALCGGLAVGIYGHVRATEDIDLLVRTGDLERALELAAGLGFDVPSGARPFAAGTSDERVVHRVSKVVGEHWLSLDLMLVTGVFEDVWAHRVARTWRNRSLTVVSLEGLVRMKRLAGRYKDLGDLVALGFEKDLPDE
jgi:hypothetical protein